jgi:hypothetical protein
MNPVGPAGHSQADLAGNAHLSEGRAEELLRRVTAAGLLLAAAVPHLLLHLVELLLLVVGENVADFGVCGLSQAAHLAAPIVLGKRIVFHHRLRLGALVFEDRFHLGLLVRGEIQAVRKPFDLIVDAGHAASLSLALALPLALLLVTSARRGWWILPGEGGSP